MSAIRLLQAERKEEIQHLHRQFMSVFITSGMTAPTCIHRFMRWLSKNWMHTEI